MNHRKWLIAVPMTALAGIVGTAAVYAVTHSMNAAGAAGAVCLVVLQAAMNAHISALRRAIKN